ncbi:MAG: hypothetical protein EB048_07995 [Gammaproteobacteria bacterium]|nr:hypothetical protein [Gammaproteobacteria bacterium]
MVEQSDGALWESVLAAEIHPLLCALALLTNDHALVDPRFSPIVELPAAGPPPHWGLSDAMVDEARLRAFEHLRGIRDRARDLECDPSPSMLERTLEFAVGRDHGVSAGLIRRELDLPHDPEAPDWCAEHIATGRTFRVAIIGAGMSGILVAHRLQQAGIDYTVFEKTGNVGGTWSQNTYPGCRLDTPNFAYSYAFAQNPNWPSEFSEQRDILVFFEQLTQKFSITDRVQLESEVIGQRGGAVGTTEDSRNPRRRSICRYSMAYGTLESRCEFERQAGWRDRYRSQCVSSGACDSVRSRLGGGVPAQSAVDVTHAALSRDHYRRSSTLAWRAAALRPMVTFFSGLGDDPRPLGPGPRRRDVSTCRLRFRCKRGVASIAAATNGATLCGSPRFAAIPSAELSPGRQTHVA